MLDNITKRKINSLRDILVGKLPDPKAQVEQITNGLIYKFMNDMDEQSASMGGKSTYFSGKFQKYSWNNLMDTKTSGVEKIKLYSEAIEQMYTNENLPELFREIFKNSFLPFKDPSTLNMFLKEINEFHYSHSEKLGDAFEYLLSFMGSQGDAGQFRTPRHIIDFIVEIVNPQKNETILDPACGTAGFLISSYKHILNQNTKKNLGDGLTASDRKKIGDNLNGYDISPDMVKMSLVNMYLHKFSNPKINEYDTLSSEERWNEYYDVILANPPFFSPRGGITPHNRFGVKSSKAEVLFVDYINEHLKPNGRAGIIIPEGIIFQSGKAYKQLRKNLINSSLVGVISLPSGIFNPYSAVKTSLLILNKAKNKKIDYIFFGIVKTDGFSLTSSRKKSGSNDLEQIVSNYQNFYQEEEIIESDKSFLVSKEEILKNDDTSFSYGEYIEEKTISEDKNFAKLETLIEESKVKYNNEKRVIWSVSNKKGFVNPDTLFTHQIASDDIKNYKRVDINSFAYNPSRINVGSIAINQSDGLGFVSPMYVVFKNANDKILNNEYLFKLLKSEIGIKKIKEKSIGTVRNTLKFKDLTSISIPLPKLEIQNQILEELDGYQKVIDGCRQIVENYKPSIYIDPNWETIELGELYDENLDSKRIPIEKSKRNKGNFPYYGASGIVDYVDDYIFDDELLLISEDGANLIARKYPICFSAKGKFWVNNHAHIIRVDDKILFKYLEYYLNATDLKKYITGSAQPKLNRKNMDKIKIKIPEKKLMKQIVEEINIELDIVNKNKDLIVNFDNKVKNKINLIWLN
ncbi:N-6 DNA methylase [Candidatus Pelagibacter sp.]|nr:N-6 DNA methylase [Candidatus Pelagibacter sp.]